MESQNHCRIFDGFVIKETTKNWSQYSLSDITNLEMIDQDLHIIKEEMIPTYTDSVKVNDTLSRIHREGVKTLCVRMIGADGSLVCENDDERLELIQATEITKAGQYSIIWDKVL